MPLQPQCQTVGAYVMVLATFMWSIDRNKNEFTLCGATPLLRELVNEKLN